MSTFLKNLAKRAAGAPLSTECLPTLGHALERPLGSSETFQEIAVEDSTNVSPEAQLVNQSPSVTASATSSRPAVQRSMMPMDTPVSTPRHSERASQSAQTPAGSLEPISSEIDTSVTAPTAIENSTETRTPDRIPAIKVQETQLNNLNLPAQPAIRLQPGPAESDLVEHPDARLAPLQTGLPVTTEPSVNTDQMSEPIRGTKSDQMIRPAVVEQSTQFQFPKIIPVTPQSGSIPIHVRVGRVEVRGSPPSEPARPAPKEKAPLGFAAYQRVRRYRI